MIKVVKMYFSAKSCLPGYPFGGYPYSTGMYNPYLYSGLYPRLGGIYREPAKGPTMASGSFASGSQPHFAAQFDDVAVITFFFWIES